MEFAGPDLPVPRVLEIGDAFDGAYAISCFTPVFLEELDAEGMQRAPPALLRALDVVCQFAHHDKRSMPWGDWLRDALIDHPGARVSGWREKIAASSEELDAVARRQNAF